MRMPEEKEPNLYVLLRCVVCLEVDFKLEDRLLRSGNPKCKRCGGLMREPADIA